MFVRLLEEYERDFTIVLLWVVTFPEAASLRLRQLKFSHRQREERDLFVHGNNSCTQIVQVCQLFIHQNIHLILLYHM